MYVGDLLIAHGLVTASDVTDALDRQKEHGGRLGDCLVAMGKVDSISLEAVLQDAPVAPSSISETGLKSRDLLNLIIKTIYSGGGDTASLIAETLRLPNCVIQLLLDQAIEDKLLVALGPDGISMVSAIRYALSDNGRQLAVDAMSQSQYIGPAPVSFSAFCQRVKHQAITKERINRAHIDRAFAGLAISENVVQQIGPAINSGRAILLYGPPGNGKTTIADRIGRVFQDVVYIPYCFEVDGQIIKVFDPGVHKSLEKKSEASTKTVGLRREVFDARWVPCHRPLVVAGGELTLEMLDLNFNPLSKFYEAPLHVKALGGIFMIDDFGRQIVSPVALLNRWIVPLERRVDYLKLHTGKSFSLPFEELIIFSTNMSPQDLIDPAFLRRIPYKLAICGPSVPQYQQILRQCSKDSGLDLSEQIIDVIVNAVRDDGGIHLACYQPKFIVDQICAASKFAGTPPRFDRGLLDVVLSNLSVKNDPQPLA